MALHLSRAQTSIYLVDFEIDSNDFSCGQCHPFVALPRNDHRFAPQSILLYRDHAIHRDHLSGACDYWNSHDHRVHAVVN